MPTKTYDPTAIIAYVEFLKSQGDYHPDDIWGVHWAQKGLPIGHHLPSSREYWPEESRVEWLGGTLAVPVDDLVWALTEPEEAGTRCGTPYIVKGIENGIYDPGQVIIDYCTIVAVLDDCPATCGLPITYEIVVHDPDWPTAIHEAGHAYMSYRAGVGVRTVEIRCWAEERTQCLGGRCRQIKAPTPWQQSIIAAAGAQAELEILPTDRQGSSAARARVAEDKSRIIACCPLDQDATEWRAAAEGAAQKIVTTGKEAIMTLALALMAGRNHKRYSKLKRRKIEERFKAPAPRLADLQQNEEGLDSGNGDCM